MLTQALARELAPQVRVNGIAPGPVEFPEHGLSDEAKQAIIDKNCRIGRNVQIVTSDRRESTDETEHAMICDGIVVVPKGATVPDGCSRSGSTGGSDRSV